MGAMGEDLGDVGDRLQVVDQCGPGADTVVGVLTEEPDPVRGHDARERTATVDRLQERALLAVEVVVGSFEDGAFDPGWHQVRGPHLGEGGAGASDFGGEGALEGDDDAVGVGGPGGDEGTLDDLVGVVAEDAAILEGAGFALGAVHDDGGGGSGGGVGRDGLPLPAGREAAAAPSAQSRVEHGRGDLRRCHRVRGPQPAETTGGPVLLERCQRVGVQDAPCGRRARRTRRGTLDEQA